MTETAVQANGANPAAGAAQAAATQAASSAQVSDSAGAENGLLAFARNGNTQEQAAAQDGPKGYWPDAAKDLADKYRGLDDKATIDKLLGDLTARPKAPAAAADYKLELRPEIAAKLPEIDKDPALGVYREVALKAGLTNEQFSNTIGEFYAALAEKGLLPDTINTDREIERLMPEKGSKAERTAEAVKRIQAAHDNVRGMLANGTLSKSEASTMRGLLATADGVSALEKLFKSMGERGLQGGGHGSGGDTKDSLKQMMADPRYDTRSSKYDVKFRTDVDTRWRALHRAA